MTTNWSKRKPKLTGPGILVTATYWGKRNDGYWDIKAFTIARAEWDDVWYWGMFDENGDENWAYEDFKADWYLLLPLPGNP